MAGIMSITIFFKAKDSDLIKRRDGPILPTDKQVPALDGNLHVQESQYFDEILMKMSIRSDSTKMEIEEQTANLRSESAFAAEERV